MNPHVKHELSAYQSYYFCRETGRGGGILLYIRNEWNTERTAIPTQHMETVIVNITSDEHTFVICAVYHLPSGPIGEFLFEFEKLLGKLDHRDNLVSSRRFQHVHSCALGILTSASNLMAN